MASLRLRLMFKDGHILNELQKFEGFERSWFLVKPQLKTISDVSSSILTTFQLHRSCPDGLLLSLDGFVLPQFESTCILKDKDILSVKKKGAVLAVERNHAPNLVENMEIVEKQPVNTGPLLLANEEFDNECGGYESEEPEDEFEGKEGANLVKDGSHPDSTLGCNAISKKRKASETLPSVKKKKNCSEVAEKVDEQTEKSQQDVTSKKGLSKQKKVPDSVNKDVDGNKGCAESSKVNDGISGMKKNNNLQENGEENVEATPKPEHIRKGPSRSARRKYATRKWLREMRKIQEKNATSESEGLRNWKELKANAGKNDGNLHHASESEGLRNGKELQANVGRTDGNLHSKRHINGVTDGRPKGRRNRKQQQNEAKNQEGIGQSKGLLHWKQLREEGSSRHTNNQDEQTNEKNVLWEKPGQQSDMGDEKRPEHIRFESADEDEPVQQDQVQLGSFRSNLIACKNKGKNWGEEKVACTPKDASVKSNKEHAEMSNAEKEAHLQEPIDFNTLPFLTGPPKEGNVIAYRLLELSSTWTAKLCSYRVGKVSWYNPEANRVLLTPLPEYPLFSSEDECLMNGDNSIYKEDGSLEIDSSSLLEVRLVKNGASDSVGLSGRPSEALATNESNPVLTTGVKKADTVATGNGKVNGWEQFCETPKAKQGQLSEASGWGNWSLKSSWSQRALRGGARCSEPRNDFSKGQFSEESSWGKGNFGKSSWSQRGAFRGGAHSPRSYNGPSTGQLSEENSGGEGSFGKRPWSHRGAFRGGAHGPKSYNGPSTGQLSEENSGGEGSFGKITWSHRGAFSGGAHGPRSYNDLSTGQLSEENNGGEGSFGNTTWSRGGGRGAHRGRGRGRGRGRFGSY